MRMNRTQKNYMIIGLCAIVLLMAVGYAAFSSQLKISGTSSVSSNWDVRITNIQSKNIVGGAGNKVEPSYDVTTATFSASLQNPGDSISYDVTVSNNGSIDAKLDKITMTDSSNSAIIFETSGLKEGDLLAHGESAIFTVKVSYNSAISGQPENLNATLKVTLDYSQAENGYVPPVTETAADQLKALAVTEGDGIYVDSYEAGRYIYRGSNPNNYITFNDELWRIIAVETDGTIKIIRNDVLANRAFDTANNRTTANNSYCTNPSSGCGVYAAVEGTFSSPSGSQSGTVTEDSSIKIYLNEDYYVNDINETAKGQMVDGGHVFNIGAVEYLNSASNDSIEKNIEGEKMYTWTGNVGLANVSDILRASTNPLCTSATTSYSDYDACNSNYLLDKGTASSLYYWTINAYSYESGVYSSSAWYGGVTSSYAYVSSDTALSSNAAPRPVVFLKSDITLSGEGSKENPFQIN